MYQIGMYLYLFIKYNNKLVLNKFRILKIKNKQKNFFQKLSR